MLKINYRYWIVQTHNSTKDMNKLQVIVVPNIEVSEKKLPDFLPNGWKKEVATILGVHRNTVTNAIKSKQGQTYERIKGVVIERWGEVK